MLQPDTPASAVCPFRVLSAPPEVPDSSALHPPATRPPLSAPSGSPLPSSPLPLAGLTTLRQRLRICRCSPESGLRGLPSSHPRTSQGRERAAFPPPLLPPAGHTLLDPLALPPPLTVPTSLRQHPPSAAPRAWLRRAGARVARAAGRRPAAGRGAWCPWGGWAQTGGSKGARGRRADGQASAEQAGRAATRVRVPVLRSACWVRSEPAAPLAPL